MSAAFDMFSLSSLANYHMTPCQVTCVETPKPQSLHILPFVQQQNAFLKSQLLHMPHSLTTVTSVVYGKLTYFHQATEIVNLELGVTRRSTLPS